MSVSSFDTLREERDIFHEAVERGLRSLGLPSSHCTRELEFVAQKYNTNTQRETRSISDARLLKELEETTRLTDTRMSRRVGIWSNELIAAFCDEEPGHNAMMSHFPGEGGTGGNAGRYLHLSGPLFAENFESMQRDRSNESGLVQVHFQCTIDTCLPAQLDEDLAKHIHQVLLGEMVTCDSGEGETAPVLGSLAAFLIKLGTIDNDVSRHTILLEYRNASDFERHNRVETMLSQFLQAWKDGTNADGGILRKFTVQFILAALAAAPVTLRRRYIAGIAALAPADFRNGLIALRARIKDQYGGEGDRHGKSRNTWLWQSGHAKWLLISDILDIVWAPSNGPLGEDSRRFEPACVEDIIHQTHAYAVHIVQLMQGDEAARRAAPQVNADHIKLMSRWRSQIYELQEVILKLDYEILQAERKKLDRSSSDHDREQANKYEQEVRDQLEPVMAWQRELQRMLRQGDYEKGKQGNAKKRATGPRIPLPDFDLKWRALAPEEKLAAITTAAANHGFVATP